MPISTSILYRKWINFGTKGQP